MRAGIGTGADGQAAQVDLSDLAGDDGIGHDRVL